VFSERVTTLSPAFADRYVGVGCSGEHVARVALVSRGVGEYVTSGRSGEESVRDVDRDALFTLGAQSVGECSQVGDSVLVGHGIEVIGRQTVGVVQQSADQRALAVVDATRRGQPKELASDGGGHQK
jgi:hypothetical protein